MKRIKKDALEAVNQNKQLLNQPGRTTQPESERVGV